MLVGMKTDTTKDLETDSEETWTRLDVAASNLVMKCFRAMNEKRAGRAVETPPAGCAHDAGEVERREAKVRGFEK